MPRYPSMHSSDNYITRASDWVYIKDFIPPGITIWEPFYCDGSSGRDLEALGYKVIHNTNDFFTSCEGDMVVTNPPFSRKQDILKRLSILCKPYILLAPAYMLASVYFRKAVAGKNLAIVIPRTRIEYLEFPNSKSSQRPSFDSYFYIVGTIHQGIFFK